MSAIRIAVPGYDIARIAKISLPSLRQRAQRCCHRNGSPVAAVFFYYPLNPTSAHDGSGFAV